MLRLHLPQFEGPLALLLSLIERRELEITAISLAAVADQFVEQVAAWTEVDAATLAEFVAVGARLVLIKSRALLPRPTAASATVDEIDDAEALAEQLVAYRQARATALGLAQRQLAGQRTYARPPAPLPAGPPPLAPVSLVDLTRAVRRRLLELPAEQTPTSLTPMVSLAETIGMIEGLLARQGRLWLSSLLALASSRRHVIATFIALLELIRRRRIMVSQPLIFGEITIDPWPAPAGSEATHG